MEVEKSGACMGGGGWEALGGGILPDQEPRV